MFIEPLSSQRPALQRSAMFPATDRKSSTFCSHGARKSLLEVARSINISSLRDEKAFRWFNHFVR